MVKGRSEIVERFPDGSLVLIFRLGHGRFLAGYALGDDGMLFRGELLEASEAEARWTARIMSNELAVLDQADITFGTEKDDGRRT